jgi:hypothetical protein
MSAWLLSEFGPWLAAGGAALVAIIVAWVRGRRSASVEWQLKRANEAAETRRKTDEAEIVGDDPGRAERWLRERDRNQR